MIQQGQQLGEYEIAERLGDGQSGAVYKARQTSTGQFVALKIIDPSLASDAEYVARFRREAEFAAALKHPNLVQMYGAGESGGCNFVAMEFVPDESALSRIERKGRIGPENAIGIGVYLAGALDYAWKHAGLIHRDIKPGIIFVSREGNVKLGAFGLSSEIASFQSPPSCPDYLSPEQAEGKANIDLRANIYSLGCVLYHMLAGRPPFEGGGAAELVMAQHVSAPPPDVREVWPACPPTLAAVIRRTMHKDPAARYQSYDELATALRHAHDVLANAPVTATLARPMASGIVAPPPAVPAAAPRVSAEPTAAPPPTVRPAAPPGVPAQPTAASPATVRPAAPPGTPAQPTAVPPPTVRPAAPPSVPAQPTAASPATVRPAAPPGTPAQPAATPPASAVRAPAPPPSFRPAAIPPGTVRPAATPGVSAQPAAGPPTSAARAPAPPGVRPPGAPSQATARLAAAPPASARPAAPPPMSAQPGAVPPATAAPAVAVPEVAGKFSKRTLALVAAIVAGCVIVGLLVYFAPWKKTAPAAPAAPLESPPGVPKSSQTKPFINTLGMQFVPVRGTKVLFCIWETRVKDYAAYAQAKQVDDAWSKLEYRGTPVGREPEHPVCGVTWVDANAFCKWLTEKEAAEGKVPGGAHYRLPTDAEWSHAVGLHTEEGATPRERSGKINDVFPWGTAWPPPDKSGAYADTAYHEKFPKEKAWIDGYNDGFAETAPVGSFAANEFGIHDLGGNVWEWCADSYGPGTDGRVLRGASWDDSDRGYLLASYRIHYRPGSRYIDYGFRCVIAAAGVTQ